MSKKDERMFINVFVVILVIVIIIWFLTQVIDILKQNPQPVWFVLGIIATLAIEAIVYFSFRLSKRLRSH
ncbi:hypothetical protein ACFLUO_04145 [Chloroflexota bacterium]